jgi:hypothetical protein
LLRVGNKGPGASPRCSSHWSDAARASHCTGTRSRSWPPLTAVLRRPHPHTSLIGCSRAFGLPKYPLENVPRKRLWWNELAAGCAKVFVAQASGAQRNWHQQQATLDYRRSGDMPVVWELDRLAQPLKHSSRRSSSWRRGESVSLPHGGNRYHDGLWAAGVPHLREFGRV